MRQNTEFLSFDTDPSGKTFGFLRARFFKKLIVIYPVIQKKDGDFYVANPSKSVNVMGQWKPSEMAYFESREDRDDFANCAKEFIRSKINGNGPSTAQPINSQGNAPIQQNYANTSQNRQPSQSQFFNAADYDPFPNERNYVRN